MDFQQGFKTNTMKSLDVYNQMKKRLLNGEYFFGDKISVNNLIEEFEMSRRPIMESLKMLENDGLIEIIPQSGCKVIDYNRDDVIEDLLISSALEALGAEMAAIQHTTEEINELKEYQEKMKPLLKNNKDKAYYFQYNREIHYRCLKMAHANRIEVRASRLWDLNDFYLRNVYDQFSFDQNDAIQFHDEIIDAIEKGNPKEAKKKMEDHFNDYIKKLGKSLPEKTVNFHNINKI